MAEEVNPQTDEKENVSEDVMKEKGNRLFELVSKKELSDEEKKEIEQHITALPQALMSKSFMEHLEVPDMISLYQSGKSVQEILEKNEAALETLNTVLENLKDFKLSDNTSAAKYILDKSLLANGELIGTQFAKNIHFLGTAYTDEQTEGLQNGKLHDAVEKNYDRTIEVYKKLYDKEGYGANPKSHNSIGQKVEDVMNAVREESKKTSYRRLDDLKDQEFVQAPRQDFVVEKARQDMTIEDLKLAQYRGTLTAEQAAALKKEEEKEADLENYNGDQKRPGDNDHKNKGFKDEDIIKYMYEEWFLAGMSWLFDKAEDGMKIILDRVLYGGYDYKHPAPLKAPASENGTSFYNKAKEFNEHLGQTLSQICTDYEGGDVDGRHIEGRKEKVEKLGQELLEFCKAPTPEKENDLKQRYGEAFIEKVKTDYEKNPKNLEHFLNQSARPMLMMTELASIMAQKTAHLEMLSEAMGDKSKWLDGKSGKFKDTSELETERNERAAKIREDLIASCMIVAEEERVWAQTRFKGLNTEEEKEKFVQEEILSITDPKEKEKLEKQYESVKGDTKKLEQWVCETIAAQKMNTFLNNYQRELLAAEKTITEDLSQAKFDANDQKPRSDGGDILAGLRTGLKEIQEAAEHDAKLEGGERLQATIEHKTDLSEALKQDKLSIYFEHALSVNTREQQILEERRKNNKGRKSVLNQVKAKIFGKDNKYQKLQQEKGLPFTKPVQGRQ